MKKIIEITFKPVLIIGGLGTTLAGLNAFFPQFAVENVQKMNWTPDYTIFVQHWGIMVCLMGVFMVAAAYKVTWRAPILIYGLLEKAFMVFLVSSNAQSAFAEGFYAAAYMDSFLTLYLLLYFILKDRLGIEA